jgi:hypothetical protein
MKLFVLFQLYMQDVIITSGGKNIAPHPIEQRIKTLLPDFIRYILTSTAL